MKHPSMIIMDPHTAELPKYRDVGRMYRGGVDDDTLPSDAIVTWENTAGRSGYWQWFGHRDSKYASQKK